MHALGLILLIALIWWIGKPADMEKIDLPAVVAQLQQENWRLKFELSELRTQRGNDLEYYERQAGLALGCDWLIPTCPESAVRQGRQALAQGYGGASSLYFWLIFIAKLIAIGSTLGSAWSVAAWWWTKRGRPAAEETRRACEMVNVAEARAQAAQEQLVQYQQAGAQAKESLHLTVERLDRLQQQVKAAEVKLVRLKSAVTEQQATLKAMRNG